MKNSKKLLMILFCIITTIHFTVAQQVIKEDVQSEFRINNSDTELILETGFRNLKRPAHHYILGIEVSDDDGNIVFNYQPTEKKEGYQAYILDQKSLEYYYLNIKIPYSQFPPSLNPEEKYFLKLHLFDVNSLDKNSSPIHSFTKPLSEFISYVKASNLNYSKKDAYWGISSDLLKKKQEELKFEYHLHTSTPLNVKTSFSIYNDQNDVIYNEIKKHKITGSQQNIIEVKANEIALKTGNNKLKAVLRTYSGHSDWNEVDADSINISYYQPKKHIVSIDVNDLTVSTASNADMNKNGKHKIPDSYWQISSHDFFFESTYRQNSYTSSTGKVTYVTEKPTSFKLIIQDHDVMWDDNISNKVFTLEPNSNQKYTESFNMMESVNLSYEVQQYEPVKLNVVSEKIIKEDGVSYLQTIFTINSKLSDLPLCLVDFTNQKKLIKGLKSGEQYTITKPLTELDNQFIGVEVMPTGGAVNSIISFSAGNLISNLHQLKVRSINDVMYTWNVVPSFHKKTKVQGITTILVNTVHENYLPTEHEFSVYANHKELSPYLEGYVNTDENYVYETESEVSTKTVFIPYYELAKRGDVKSVCLQTTSNAKGVSIGNLDTCLTINVPNLESLTIKLPELKIKKYKGEKYTFTVHIGNQIVFSSEASGVIDDKVTWTENEISLVAHQNDKIYIKINTEQEKVYNKGFSVKKLKKKKSRKVSNRSVKGKLLIN